jgi:uncharacterized protein YkwD
MKRVSVLLTLALVSTGSYSQTSKLAQEVFVMINEARITPQTFLEKNRGIIDKINPAYSEFLRGAQSMSAIEWDNGLEDLARKVVENDELNPTYSGEKEYCGFSWGNGAGNIKKEAINYVIDFYTNVHGPDYRAIGIYFNSTKTGFAYQWGKSCEQKRIEFPAPEKIDTAKINFATLNTCTSAPYMRPEEKRMLVEINFVRAYPKIYAALVAQYLHKQSKSSFGLDSDDYQAGIELIAELNKLEPMRILFPSECVYEAARSHGLDSQRRGYFNHTGSDRTDPWDRILNKCPQFKTGNENGVGGFSTNPRDHVISLLIDSGIPSRGHRHNILNPSWKFGACFRYDDPTYKNFWVQNFAY